MGAKTEADRITRLENLMFEQGEIINRIREDLDELHMMVSQNQPHQHGMPDRATQ